jgi:hypothetical protein
VDDQQPRDLVEFAKTVHWKQKGEVVNLGVVVQEGRGFFSRLGVVAYPVRVR